jgi:hypothetical protein
MQELGIGFPLYRAEGDISADIQQNIESISPSAIINPLESLNTVPTKQLTWILIALAVFGLLFYVWKRIGGRL